MCVCGLGTLKCDLAKLCKFSLNLRENVLNLFSFVTVFCHTLTHSLSEHRAISEQPHDGGYTARGVDNCSCLTKL